MNKDRPCPNTSDVIDGRKIDAGWAAARSSVSAGLSSKLGSHTLCKGSSRWGSCHSRCSARALLIVGPPSQEEENHNLESLGLGAGIIIREHSKRKEPCASPSLAASRFVSQALACQQTHVFRPVDGI